MAQGSSRDLPGFYFLLDYTDRNSSVLRQVSHLIFGHWSGESEMWPWALGFASCGIKGTSKPPKVVFAILASEKGLPYAVGALSFFLVLNKQIPRPYRHWLCCILCCVFSNAAVRTPLDVGNPLWFVLAVNIVLGCHEKIELVAIILSRLVDMHSRMVVKRLRFRPWALGVFMLKTSHSRSSRHFETSSRRATLGWTSYGMKNVCIECNLVLASSMSTHIIGSVCPGTFSLYTFCSRLITRDRFTSNV